MPKNSMPKNSMSINTHLTKNIFYLKILNFNFAQKMVGDRPMLLV